MILRIFGEEIVWTGLKTFYMKRFLRLAPALGTTLITSALLISIFGDLNDLRRFVLQGIASLILAGNLGAIEYSGNYFSPNPNPLIHTWSLSVEEQIYLLLPIIITVTALLKLIINKRNVSRIFLFLSFMSLLFFLFPSFYESIGILNKFADPVNSFYFTFSRIWEFIVGAQLYLYKSKFTSFEIGKIKSLSLTFILLTLFIPIELNEKIGTAIVVILSAAYLSVDSKDRQTKFMGTLAYIGDRSYSIYLIHMPLIYLAKYSPEASKFKNQNYLVLISLVLSLILGGLQFKYIEQRFRVKANPTKSFFAFFLSPLLILSLINLSIDRNFVPLISNFSSDTINDSHLLRRANCVDVAFSPNRCTWESGKNGSILLVGDSQSYAAADGVLKATQSLGFSFTGATLSGCPFLGLETTLNKPINCLDFQSDVLKYIRLTKPKIVIIANRSYGYLNPELNWRSLIDSEGKVYNNRDEAVALYSKSLSAIVVKLNSMGIKTLLYQQVPEIDDFNNPRSLYEYIRHPSDHNSNSMKVSIDFKVRSIESRMSRELKFGLFDPSHVICGGSCGSLVDIDNSYMDSFHLSRVGSLTMSNDLASAIRGLILDSDAN